MSGCNELGDGGGWRRARVKVRLKKARETIHCVKASHIRGLDRTSNAEPAPDAVSNNRVNRFGGRGSRGPKRPGLAQRGKLNAIADEAGDFPIDDHGLFAGSAQNVADPRGDIARCVGSRTNLDQWDKLWRIPEMGRDCTLPMAYMRDKLARRMPAR